MEITLNLLPPYIQRQRDLQKRRRARNVALAVAVLPFLFAYLVLNARIHVLQTRVAILDRQVGALSPVAEKARRLENDLDDLKRRAEALDQMIVRQPRWSPVLVQLSDLLPPDAWFNSLGISNGQFVIVGQALSEGSVSTLATRLAAARLLDGTSLKYVREENLGTRRVYSFEIDGSVRTGGQNP